ncbi:MAG: amidohydrolase family protein [Balneolaceae bacterium]|nr:amidohydrolase family protein [Balneolaceae bacterium]
MKKKHYSRREFIRQNTLAGAGAFLSMGLGSALFDEKREFRDSSNGDLPLFFDAFTLIGHRQNKHPAEQWSLSHLLEELDHCSISGALVAHTLSTLYDPMYINLELSEKLQSYPHLFAIWNVMPHHSGEFPPPEKLGELMKENDVRAVTLNPGVNSWNWRAGQSEELIGWLSEEKILSILTAPAVGGWDTLGQFLERYPELPVLLRNAAWSEQRQVLPLLEKHSNLHLTFNRFQINEGPEDLLERGFGDQLIFSSHAPEMSAGAHRMYIDFADISAEEKAKIAGGNLIRLLRGQEPPVARIKENEDELMADARRGSPLQGPVLDMHMHILHEGLHGAGAHYRMVNGGPKGVFNMMNRLSEKPGGGIMSWIGVVSGDAHAGNESVIKALDAAPQGYWGLGTFDPSHYSQDELSRMIAEFYSDQRMIGMKPYPHYGIQYHHHSYDVWWEYGNENQLYALVHRSRGDGLEVEVLAEKYPNVRWVIAHAGGSYEWADIAIEAMNKFSNVYAELTFTSVPLGIIEYLADHAGEDRIVYGSDLPMRDPRQQLGWVIYSRLPLAAKKKVLAQNALEVIQPCLDRLPAYNHPVFL